MLKAYIRVFHFSGYVLSALRHVSPLKSICCSCSSVDSSFVLKLILLSFTPFWGIGSSGMKRVDFLFGIITVSVVEILEKRNSNNVTQLGLQSPLYGILVLL